MRVLFVSYSDKTVFQPMVPLAWALRTAGHEVRVAVQPDFAPVVTQAGLTAVPVGRDRATWRLAGVFSPERSEAERDGLPAPYDAAVADPESLDFATMRDAYEHMVEHWHRMDNFPMIAGLLDFARSWQPDLVVWESITYAGALAARACGAASARLLWSFDVFGRTRQRFVRLRDQQPADDRGDPLANWLAPYAQRLGREFGEDYVTGDFTIDTLPASLRMDADLNYVRVGYVPYGGAATVPRWVWAESGRPRVVLTLGLTATDRFAGYAVNSQDLLDALADLDIELIATLAESEQRKLARVPDNTRLVSYVPLHALAPTCVAAITHAGPGTLLTLARYGVPQLTVPYDFDEPALAGLAAAQGGSLTVNAGEATGEMVRDGLLRLLTEPRFRERAAALRAEMLDEPSPNEIVGQLEELTVKHRTAAR